MQVQGGYDLQAHDGEGRWPDASALLVQPGTLDLVLQFPRPRWIEVSVRSSAGGPLVEYAATILSADKKRTLRPGKFELHEGGRASLLVPAEPFTVDVRARGHGHAVLGPWAPDATPATASCALDRIPGVRGRAKAGDSPVGGAKVSLYEMAREHTRISRNGFPTRLHPEPEDTATTDEQGYFQLDPSRPGGADKPRFYQRDAKDPGTFAILCEADGWALAEVSPLEIDPAVGVEGIEIALVLGGAIEGRVLTAPGKDPAGVIVGIDRTDGKPRTKRVGPDGRYRFEHLTPGRYRVARSETEWRGDGFSTSWSTGDEVHAEYPTNCAVDDGRTTRFDLDLHDDEPCVLVAQVSVNGAPAVGWTASLWPKENATARKIPGGAIDAQGRLRLEVSEPGEGRLELRPPAESNPESSFEVQVTLHRGENPLPVDLRVGAIHGRCAATPGGSVLDFYAEASGSITCNASAHSDANGRFEMPFVLAARGKVVRSDVRTDGTIVGLNGEAEVDVPAGGSVDIEVP